MALARLAAGLVACRFLFLGFLRLSAWFPGFHSHLWFVVGASHCGSSIEWTFTFNCVGFVMVHVVFTWVWLG